MVILFCGIPGSGKTTIAKRLAKRLQTAGRVKIFISDKLKPPVYQKFFRLLKENIKRYDFLIFDATFYKTQWRQKMKTLAKGEKVITVYLSCSLKTALERNKKRRPRIPEKAVHIISSQMAKPKTPDIILNTEAISIADAVNKVFNAVLKMKKKDAVLPHAASRRAHTPFRYV